MPDYTTYNIPESAYDGISASDLQALIEYLNSQSAELADWRAEQAANQKVLIEQGKNQLDALNKMPNNIWQFFNDPITSIKQGVLQIVDLLINLPVYIMDLPTEIWEFFEAPVLSMQADIADIPVIGGYVASIPNKIDSLIDGLFNIQDTLLPVIQTLPDLYRGFALGIDAIPDTLTSIWTELSAQLGAFKEAVLPDPFIPLIQGVLDRLDSINDKLVDPDTDPGGDGDTVPDPDPDDTNPSTPGTGDSDNGSGTPDIGLVNGCLLLIYILFMLLKIFLHLLEFIVNIFKIGADPGFITGDFATGFNYIKTVELTGMGVSVYDFLMVLVHISIIFGIVKVLRKRIESLHL
jgi:hypothetical protein